ncbi:MAG TPA: WYL domain-containing protein, partial [Thermoleophilia bacterium]|nr:WYL domain-containing protein [Thermoleophilia bacterium]HQG53990.1 WYL domain-containing protein [Thermoleophilia bacterium]
GAAPEAGAAGLAVVAEPGPGAAVLPKLQAAIAERKTVVFRYYAIGRDEERERTVDPYGLQLVGDEWYLIGFCHLRQAVRTFRLSRIRSRVTYATRAPHDFSLPEDFDLAAYRDRPPWRLGAAVGEACIRVAADMAWWVQAHYARCGTIERLDDNDIRFTTAYSSAPEILAWVLGLGEYATLEGPEELRTELRAQLDRLDALLAAPPPDLAGAAPAAAPKARRRRRTGDDWRVEVDRFTRLTALATYLLRHCDESGEGLLPVSRVCEDLDLTPEELRADVRLLNLVNFGADGALLFAQYKDRDTIEVWCDLAGETFARPARLSPLQADTLLLAIELVGGQAPVASGAALASAAEKLRAARYAGPPTLAASAQLPPQDDVFAAVSAAIRDRRLLDIEYWSEGTGETTERTVEPYLMVRSRGEWYYVCYCRRAQGRRVFRVATTKRAVLRDETFAPRPDLELELYRREGIPSSQAYAPRTATVWYSPRAARYVEEEQPVDRLPDGSCVVRQPYLDDPWLVHHLLRFAGEARPLAPADAVEAMRRTVRRLREQYGDGGDA